MYREEDYITTDKFLWWSKSFPETSLSYYKHDFLFTHGNWRNQQVTPCVNKKSRVVLVGHSDFSMTDEIALRIKEETNCEFIFSINNMSTLEWVKPLPLGLTNCTLESDIHPVFGDVRMMNALSDYSPVIHNQVYWNCSIHTAPHIRQPIYNYMCKLPFVTVGKTENTLEGRKQFLKDIKQHRFVVCPEGNGVDTHRLWETLYCGRIPIVKRSNAHSLLKELPICWVDDWTEVTLEWLESEYKRITTNFSMDKKIEMCTMNWWKKYIVNTCSIYESIKKPIRLFNLDLHISVIADLTHNLKHLYGEQFEITNWSISGHSWVFKNESKKTLHITADNWRNITQMQIDSFINEYREMLSEYDGYIVTHTPVFVLLYESFRKPIILINSCRYDQPFCWNPNDELLSRLNKTMVRLQQQKLLIAISNNRADQEYLFKGSGVVSHYIPSLCEYTNATYTPSTEKQNGIMISNEHITPPTAIPKSSLGRFKWKELYTYPFFIHIPYEISTMTMFEQYSAGCPLLFPTPRLLLELLSTNSIHFYGPYSNRTPMCSPLLEECLSSKERMLWWIKRADYYDQSNFYGCTYFDTFDELLKITSSFTDRYKKERDFFITKRRIKVLGDLDSCITKQFPVYRIN